MIGTRPAAVLAALLSLAAPPAWADGEALIIGNARYQNFERIFGASDIVEAREALRDAGVEVSVVQNAEARAMREAFARFIDGLADADEDAPVIIMLSGAFLHSDAGSYLLQTDLAADAPGGSVLLDAFPVDTALTVLAGYPGRAFLLLGEGTLTEGAPGDGLLREGLGEIEVPQGVTVFRGPARDVADFATSDLTRPGLRILDAAQARELDVTGFLPSNLTVLRAEAVARAREAALARQAAIEDAAEAERRRAKEAARAAAEEQAAREADAEEAARRAEEEARAAEARAAEAARQAELEAEAERARAAAEAEARDAARRAEEAAAAERAAREAEEAARRAEAERQADRAAWDAAQAADNAEAYRAYLDDHPQGENAAQARQRIAAIEDEPFYAERRREDALDLSRDARREIQRDLSILGYDTRGIDGVFGPGTRGAIRSWQESRGIAATGYLTETQISRLGELAVTRADALEAEALERQAAFEARDRSTWQRVEAAGDEASLRSYLDAFPEGLYAARARAMLDDLERLRASRVQSRDRAAWELARDGDTIASYRRYIETNPGGAFVKAAEGRIAEIERAQDAARAQTRAKAEEEQLQLNATARRLAEARMKQLGLDVGRVDGTFDRATRRAIRDYQRARALPVSGFLDQATVVRLLAGTVLGTE